MITLFHYDNSATYQIVEGKIQLGSKVIEFTYGQKKWKSGGSVSDVAIYLKCRPIILEIH